MDNVDANQKSVLEYKARLEADFKIQQESIERSKLAITYIKKMLKLVESQLSSKIESVEEHEKAN